MTPSRKYGCRVDNNQKAIVKALRDAGANVLHLHTVGSGVPDLLVEYAGKLTMLEVKGPKGRLTPQQEEFFALWDNCCVVRTIEEALAEIGAPDRRG